MTIGRRIIATVSATIFMSAFAITNAGAAVTNWNAGNIIDDAVFTNKSTMSVGQIQTFLNSKVPTCDTNGLQPSELNNSNVPDYNGDGVIERWERGKYLYGETTFTCLKDYSENGISAAQIIYNAAQQYNINPQVLIVVLQKEQSLVTDTWPVTNQYKMATGYGCPDTGSCNTAYYGLTNQINHTAYMFHAIMIKNPNWYSPYVTGSNYILWNPNSSCGGSNVTIQNLSTAALYDYTPYQPNQAALIAGWGTGDNCSAYGNRNFYLYFTNWFGSTQAINGNVTMSSSLSISSTSGSSINEGDTVTASYTIKNSGGYSITAGRFGVCARMNGEWFDFGKTDIGTLGAGASSTISFSKTMTTSGSLYMFACSYSDALGGWASDYYPYDYTGGIIRSATRSVAANPVITSGINLSPTPKYAGDKTTASMVIKNNASIPVNVGRIVFSVRDSSGENYDFPSTALTIPANSSVTYSQTRSFPKADTFSLSENNNFNGVWIGVHPTFPAGTQSALNFTTTQNPVIIEGLKLTSQYSSVGKQITVEFKIQNSSNSAINVGRPFVSARDPNGNNFDFPSSQVTIPANSTYTYSQSRTPTVPGEYKLSYVNNIEGSWSTTSPGFSSSNIIGNLSTTATTNPYVSAGASVSPTNASTGSTVTATITLRNDSSTPQHVGRIVFAVRDSHGSNYDFPSSDLTIPANSSMTYTKTRTFTIEGTYSLHMANNYNGTWTSLPPYQDNAVDQKTFTVKP